MVRNTPPSQDASTHQIWNPYLKEYRRYAPDTKRDGPTDGLTDRWTDSAITIFLWVHNYAPGTKNGLAPGKLNWYNIVTWDPLNAKEIHINEPVCICENVWLSWQPEMTSQLLVKAFNTCRL